MASQFKADERVEKGIRRIARGQIARALDGLAGRTDAGPGEVVHDVRRRLKKVRALVRLARSGLGRKAAHREGDRLRDAGRALSEVRDAGVLVAALDALVARLGDRGRAEAIAAAREALVAECRAVERRVLDEGDALAESVRSLEEFRRDAGHWEVEERGWAALEGGLRRIYGRGYRMSRTIPPTPTDEVLHEWRKRVKDLGYALDIFEAIRPEYTTSRRELAHKLASLLGDDHDLAVLRSRFSGPGEGGILPLIDARRLELRREALSLGPILYAEGPRRFVARIGAYWKAWRSEAEAAGFDLM